MSEKETSYIDSYTISDIKDWISEKISSSELDSTLVQDTSNQDWPVKNKLIQLRLNKANTGVTLEANPDDMTLVNYTYPEYSRFKACLFFTNNNGSAVLGFPDTATESLGDRAYFGIMVYKNGDVELQYSYGNKLFKKVVKKLEELDANEAEFVYSLLDNWDPLY